MPDPTASPMDLSASRGQGVHPRRPLLVVVLLVASLVLNLSALVLPFVTIDAAGSDPWVYGLLGSVQMLWGEGMVALAVLVFTFSVVFPFAKLGVLGWLWWNGVTTPTRHALLMRVEKLGKWSLFDVFLVAIMVALTNDQWLISSASLPGLTCFLAAVVLGMTAGELLSATCGHAPPPPPLASPPGAVLLGLVVIIGVLLGLTITVPFITIDDWRLVDRSFSLAALVPALWQNGSPMLALALGAFVLATPVLGWLVAAITVLGWWNRPLPVPVLHLGALIRRWSMLSVFALSLGVFLAEGHHFLATKADHAVWTLVAGLGLAWIGQLLLARLSGGRS